MKLKSMIGAATLYLSACAAPYTQQNPTPPPLNAQEACLNEAFISYHWQGDGKIDQPFCQNLESKYQSAINNITTILREDYVLEHKVLGMQEQFMTAPATLVELAINLTELRKIATQFEQQYPQNQRDYLTDIQKLKQAAHDVATASTHIKDQLLAGGHIYSDLRAAWYNGTLNKPLVDSLNTRLQGVRDAMDTVDAIHTLKETVELYRETIELDLKQRQVSTLNLEQTVIEEI